MDTSTLVDCSHYRRGCQFVSPCCSGKLVRCRICHDNECLDHEFDRFSVQNVCCNQCETVQPIAEKCVNCSLLFGTYFCAICRLYDYNDETNPYFHCPDCGICRKGLSTNYFHCHTCGVCFSLQAKNTHRCSKAVFHNDCCVCTQNLFNSREPVIILPCLHPIHVECRNKWIQRSIGCPLCRKTMLEPDALQQYNQFMDNMLHPPQQLENNAEESQEEPEQEVQIPSITIYCNDCCNQQDSVMFNVFAYKCPQCNSYNTYQV